VAETVETSVATLNILKERKAIESRKIGKGQFPSANWKAGPSSVRRLMYNVSGRQIGGDITRP
jgi:hypothetical protein